MLLSCVRSNQLFISFRKLGVWPYQKMVETAAKWQLPSLGELIWKGCNIGNWFASNLTYTYNNFSNNLHMDFDENDFTFGIWFPVFSDSTV